MPELRIDVSECSRTDELASEPFEYWNGPRLTLRPLRKLADGSIRSGIITLESTWSGEIASWDTGTLQLFLVEGRIEADADRITATGFIVLGPGSRLPVRAVENTTLILIRDPRGSSAALPPGKPLVIASAMAMTPVYPVIEGKLLEGFEVRRLWLDAETGADTQLLHVPAGFQGGGPNWHPVHEEIYCIAGDIQPDETRPMRAGSFLWNPAYAVHGFEERTEGGSVLLEWHDGPWNLTYALDAVRPAKT